MCKRRIAWPAEGVAFAAHPRAVWLASLASALALWAAMPPLNFWLIAWVAPLGWLWLVRLPALPGKRPMIAVWFSGWVFWALSLEWLRHAYWAAGVGMLFLAAYFAVYVVGFVWLARFAHWRWRLPLVVAAPGAWMIAELVRGHVMGGFTMSSLGHTQHRWLELVQTADLFGAYGVGGIVMLGAAALSLVLPGAPPGRRWPSWLAALVTIGAAHFYGRAQLASAPQRSIGPIALVQGAIDTEVKHDPTQHNRVLKEYFGVSRRALAELPDCRLLIWPETMFRDPLYTFDANAALPAEATRTLADLAEADRYSRDLMARMAHEFNTSLLLGVDVLNIGPGSWQFYNSAVLVSADGALADRYDKTHPVWFGEYVPLGDVLPLVYRLLPVPQGLEVGRRDPRFDFQGTTLGVDICYELLVPHLMRRQVLDSAAAGDEIEVLVNLTNNGYYGGSAELDLHLVSGAFRAIELGKPVIIAANAGFSAWIDDRGRIRAQGLRRAATVVAARPTPMRRRTLYTRLGDVPLWCLTCLTLSAALGQVWADRRVSRGS